MVQPFIFLSVDDDIYDTDLVINSHSIERPSSGNEWSVRMQRLRGGLSEGVDVIRLDNGFMHLSILPTRGMGIWKGRAGAIPLEWKSPVERPVHPTFVDQNRRGGIGWLDGFNELLCRCGLGWHGAPGTDVRRDSSGKVLSEQFLPLHGRIANLSAHHVSSEVTEDGAICVTGIVDEASLFGGRLRLTSTLRTYIGSNTFEIVDTVQNLGSSAAEVEMLYHCNFGRPFLSEGASFHHAAAEVVPRNARAAEGISTWQQYQRPVSGYAEQVYFTQPLADADGRGLAVLSSPGNDMAAAIRFDVSTLPWFTLWKNTQAEQDGYVTGLEPGSSFPNLRSFERENGRVISLTSQQSITFELAVTVATHPDDTARLIKEVADIQNGPSPKVHSQPLPTWCS